MSAAQQTICHVRKLVPMDLDQVLAIERASYQFPWSAGIFRDCLRVGYRCFAAVDIGGTLLGYGLLSIGVGEAHVLNICVSPAHRRRGVASMLMETMMREARRAAAESMLLEVRPSNDSAVALYQGMGFTRIGLRKRYYPAADGREDALLLAMKL